MSVRAFYHDKLPGDPTVPFDSSRPVPLETLASLKLDVFSVDGPDYEKNSQQLVQELGFTLSESSRTIFDSRGTAVSLSLVIEVNYYFKNAVRIGSRRFTHQGCDVYVGIDFRVKCV